MLRRLLRVLALCVLTLIPWVPAAYAQQAAPAEETKSERPTFALPYTVLALYTLAVLTIVCMPSRKA